MSARRLDRETARDEARGEAPGPELVRTVLREWDPVQREGTLRREESHRVRVAMLEQAAEADARRAHRKAFLHALVPVAAGLVLATVGSLAVLLMRHDHAERRVAAEAQASRDGSVAGEPAAPTVVSQPTAPDLEASANEPEARLQEAAGLVPAAPAATPKDRAARHPDEASPPSASGSATQLASVLDTDRPSPPHRMRHVEMVAPGGTRIYWQLDSEFSLPPILEATRNHTETIN